MFESRFAEKEWGWTLSDGEVLYLGEQQVMVPNYKLLSKSDPNKKPYLNIVGILAKEAGSSHDGLRTRQCYLCSLQKICRTTESLPKRVQDRVILFAEVIPIKSVLELLDKIKS